MMSQVEQQVECSTCPWNKFCVEPPSMTKEEVDEKTKPPSREELGDEGEKKLMGGMLSAIFYVGKDQDCRACSVFIERLRQGPELSTKIRTLMREG